MQISEINIYPIKSLKGISVESAVIERRGLQYDRRWMLADDRDWFVTQRQLPKMATIGVAVDNGQLKVESARAGSMTIPFEPVDPIKADVRIWRNRVRAHAYGDEINEWFSDALGVKLRLVKMPDSTKRLAHAAYKVRPDDHVSFADGYPFLLIGEGSLDDINSRLETPVPMTRFRPNFVVSGTEPFEEDGWRKIKIGETVFWGVKLCGRCVITTVDQDTGNKGTEPLKTLAKYRIRRVGTKRDVRFGQNLIADTAGGTVRVGDKVEALE